MILPTKYIPLQKSLLALGSIVLKNLKRPQSISSLWEKMRHVPEMGTFERFTLVLDLLFALDLVGFDRGLLFRVKA
jgi:hypothetical protein